MKRTGNNADGKTWREVELERRVSELLADLGRLHEPPKRANNRVRDF